MCSRDFVYKTEGHFHFRWTCLNSDSVVKGFVCKIEVEFHSRFLYLFILERFLSYNWWNIIYFLAIILSGISFTKLRGLTVSCCLTASLRGPVQTLWRCHGWEGEWNVIISVLRFSWFLSLLISKIRLFEISSQKLSTFSRSRLCSI